MESKVFWASKGCDIINSLSVTDTRTYYYCSPQVFKYSYDRYFLTRDNFVVDGLFSQLLVYYYSKVLLPVQNIDLSGVWPELIQWIQDNDMKLHILGGSSEEVQYFADKHAFLKTKIYPVDGFRDVNFYTNYIKQLGCDDIVLMSLGSEKQVDVSMTLKECSCNVIHSGAFVSQYYEARGEKYYPVYFDFPGLRIFYRLYKESLARRHTVSYSFMLKTILKWKLS
jgi:hypothetical protein